ncbi:putative disease resistance protein [Gossypium australe]|uniref:Putative disease resistance protein n=1 Tax=Gossypium australe TaxID=47621 RepID=A0A5B6UTQ9_9ROSI|nr:putative disease resistance protein [Gossypium australe]
MSQQSSNQNDSTDGSSEKKALYDEFRAKFPEDDKEPQRHEICPRENFRFFDRTNNPSGSRDQEEVSKEDLDLDSFNLKEEEIPEFLKKIYQPVILGEVKGFDYDEKTLKMLLLNENSQQDELKLLGVVGMVGVGKTTLCRLILEEEQVKQSYFPRLLINMSGSMEEVVEKMLGHLGVELDEIKNSIANENKLPGLLYALHLKLEGKKFLIVLDDVKKEGEYCDKLISCLKSGHGFPKGYGGAVILNGRNEGAIKGIVGERNLHRLQLLSDPEDCWHIYRSLALGDSGHPDARTREIPSGPIEELKKKCGGLPLVARIMGELKQRQDKTRGKKHAPHQPSNGSGVDPNDTTPQDNTG